MQKPPLQRWFEQKVVLPETQEAYQEKAQFISAGLQPKEMTKWVLLISAILTVIKILVEVIQLLH